MKTIAMKASMSRAKFARMHANAHAHAQHNAGHGNAQAPGHHRQLSYSTMYPPMPGMDSTTYAPPTFGTAYDMQYGSSTLSPHFMTTVTIFFSKYVL